MGSLGVLKTFGLLKKAFVRGVLYNITMRGSVTVAVVVDLKLISTILLLILVGK